MQLIETRVFDEPDRAGVAAELAESGSGFLLVEIGEAFDVEYLD